MRPSAFLVVVSVALQAASCDTTTLPPEPPPGPPAWTLGECVNTPGVIALFIGGPDFTCSSEAGTSESALAALGYLGGDFYFHARGRSALLVLDDPANFGLAHSLDLSTGAVVRLSVEGTTDSQIARAGAERFLIADYTSYGGRSDTARFAFSFLERESLQNTLRIEVPGVGYVRFLDADYDAASNKSAHLFVTTPGSVVRLITVDHSLGTYRLEDISYSFRPNSVRYQIDGTVLILDPIRGTIHSVTDNGTLVLDMGEREDDVTIQTLFDDSYGEVYTFTSEQSGTRVLRLVAGGGVEEVVALDRPQRYMYSSASADIVCLREFRPLTWSEPTYDDVVSVYDLRERTLTTRTVTLRTDYYEFPRFACF